MARAARGPRAQENAETGVAPVVAPVVEAKVEAAVVPAAEPPVEPTAKAGTGRWPAEQVPVIECPFCHKACKAPLYKGAKQLVGGDAKIAGVYRYRKCGGCAATYRTVELYGGPSAGVEVVKI